MPTDNNGTAKDAARKLLDKVKQLDGCTADSPQWKAAYDQVADAWETLRDLTLKSSTTSIATFFQTIGSGLIDAQRKLDIESENYVRSALERSSDPKGAATATPAMATTFRIPRVNAELKCSLETDREQKLNLIFYSDRNDVRELHQQTVQLEIVSVPAPADYINYLRSTPTRSALPPPPDASADDDQDEEDDEAVTVVDANNNVTTVTPSKPSPPSKPKPHIFSFDQATDDEEEDSLPAGWRGRFADGAARDEAKSIIEALDQKQNGLRRTLVKDLLLPSWSQALLFTDGQNARFIALALQGKRPELLLWQLMIRPAALQLIYRLPAAQKAKRELGRMQRLLFEIGTTQAKAADKK